jgi:hypothetical protein
MIGGYPVQWTDPHVKALLSGLESIYRMEDIIPVTPQHHPRRAPGRSWCRTGASCSVIRSSSSSRRYGVAVEPPSPGCGACASRDGLIAEQAVLIAELVAANARVAERVTALERAAGRNSENSSMPASTDGLPGRTTPARRRSKGSGRGRGKQPGAPGSTLRCVAEPDEHVAHRPQGICGCGADLLGAAEVGVERSHQVHDLPAMRIRVRQHDLYRVCSRCGRCTVIFAAQRPQTTSPRAE